MLDDKWINISGEVNLFVFSLLFAVTVWRHDVSFRFCKAMPTESYDNCLCDFLLTYINAIIMNRPSEYILPLEHSGWSVA